MAIPLRIVLPLWLLLSACGSENPGAPPANSVTAGQAEGAPAMPRSAAPADARLYFVEPNDGAVVTSPVNVVFGLEGMTVVPAGTAAPASGHHHLLVDAPLPPVDQPIPADANHIHFGTGATSTRVELASGEHTLQLLLGDHLHIPHDPPVASEIIRITVE